MLPLIGAVLYYIAVALGAYFVAKVSLTSIEKWTPIDFDWVDSDGDGSGQGDDTKYDDLVDKATGGLAMGGIILVGALLWWGSSK
jgi:hypothetical protein